MHVFMPTFPPLHHTGKGSIGHYIIAFSLLKHSLLVFTAELYQISLSRCRERLALAQTRSRSGKLGTFVGSVVVCTHM